LRRASTADYRVEVTGAEFASRYTVLKPLDQRSVRSFVAQELSTRRAVMVHWLDQLSATDRASTLARLDRLPPEARERLLVVETVDGAPVIVTRMILDFESLPKWLDKAAPPSTATGPTPAAPAAPKSGGFTDVFMGPAAAPPRGAPVTETESPTVAWTPPSAPKPEPKPEAKPEPKPEAKPHPPISVRFREPGSGPKAPAPPAPPPPKAAPPPPPPKPPPPAAPAAGEFTRIFGAARAEPEPPPPQQQFMPSPPPPPPLPSVSGGASATSALARVSSPPPVSPTLPPMTTPPASMPWSGPPPVEPLPPMRTPMPAMPGANINSSPAAPVMPAQPVQSDFTRIIGAAHASPPAPTPVPATPAPPPAAAPAPAGKRALPVLIALGTLALSALTMLIYFIIRRR
jgi:hypothetical protein